ncbi:amino acid deaminase, partial [Burkholderia pseudomallei]
GVRDDAQRDGVLAAFARHAGVLELAGIELYAGVLTEEGEIRAFLRRAVKLVHELAAAGRFARAPALLSGAGSAWYHVVADEFAPAAAAGVIDV